MDKSTDMSTTKLKLRLEKFEKAIAIQILEQDERWRGSLISQDLKKERARKIFTASNGFIISSAEYPEIFNDKLYVRGYSRASDLFVRILYFESNEKRDAYITTLFDALREWAQKAPEFAPDPKDNQEGNIHTF